MGVGLYLRGTFRSSKRKDPVTGWLTDVANWVGEFADDDDFLGSYYVRARQGRTHDDRPALFVDLHPCAEEVEFIVPESGEVIVSAKTSTVGPGYHTALCH